MAKTTTAAQYKKLIDLLSEREDIAKGFPKDGKSSANSFWENVAAELNSLGPPTKDAQMWRRVWIDYKSYVKKKLTHNKKELSATGGGPNKLHILSNMEEEVARITCMRSNVDGIRGLAFGKDVATTSTSASTEIVEEFEFEAAEADESMNSIRSRQSREGSSGVRGTSTSLDSVQLLREHINLQKEFLEKLNDSVKSVGLKQEDINKNLLDLNNNVKRVYRGINRIHDEMKASNLEKERHNRQMEQIEREKLRLKQQIYELQVSQLN